MNKNNETVCNTLRYIKNLLGIIMAVVIFAGIVHTLNYLYCSTDHITKYRLTWHSFYEEEGKITDLFLGSSHVYADVDPRILDEMIGGNYFDLASAVQRMNGTFYLLKEADRKNSLKHVYLEMYFLCSTKDNFHENTDPIDTQYDRNWRNMDHMRLSTNKLAYMASGGGGITQYPDILLPFTRYRSMLGDWEFVQNNIEAKNREDYLAYQINGVKYRGKGFYELETSLTGKSKHCSQIRIFDEHPIGEQSSQYLRKIIMYCKEQDIPITLFASPMCDLLLVSTGHYDYYVNEVREIAEEYGIPFYDFNLAKSEYLPIQKDSYYTDIDHLNTAGAEIFTAFLGQVIQQDASENQKYFYASYAEKLRETSPILYGIYYRYTENENEEKSRYMYIASNRDTGMEYRIILTPEDGEPYMIQDFDENKEFAVSPQEHGLCTIVARMADQPSDVIQTMEINY